MKKWFDYSAQGNLCRKFDFSIEFIVKEGEG